MEVQAETAGRLSIVVPAGSRVEPGSVVGRITEEAPAERAAPAAERAAPVESVAAARPAARVEAPHREPPARVEAPRPPTTPHDGDGRSVAASETDAEREPMSQLRRTIAARLVEAQRTAAILTTFNEVDLGELMTLRARHSAAAAAFSAAAWIRWAAGTSKRFTSSSSRSVRRSTLLSVPSFCPCRYVVRSVTSK